MNDREGLFRHHLDLADWIAAGYYSKIPGTLPEEVTNEAYLALHRATECYDSTRGSFEPYAKQAIRNALNNLYNKEKVRAAKEQPEAAFIPSSLDSSSDTEKTWEEPDERADVFVAIRKRETRGILAKLLASYPERPRKVLELHAQGFSYAEIGNQLGISKQAAQQHAAAALADMKTRLEEFGYRRLDSIGLLLFETAEELFSENS